jgi:hypothetical protein
VTSGAFDGLDVSWAARSEEPNGLTSPEELIAAAHVVLMALGPAKEGHAPEELKTSATVTFQPGEGIANRLTSPDVRAWMSRPLQRSRRRRTARSRRRRWRPEQPYRASKANLIRRWPAVEPLLDEVERSYREAQERMSGPPSTRPPRTPWDASEAEAPRLPSAGARRAPIWTMFEDSDLRELVAGSGTAGLLEEELKVALVETDPTDNKDVIIEIRQGVGTKPLCGRPTYRA